MKTRNIIAVLITLLLGVFASQVVASVYHVDPLASLAITEIGLFGLRSSLPYFKMPESALFEFVLVPGETSRQLKEKRSTVETKAKEILDKVKTENRAFSDQEQSEITICERDLEAIDKAINAVEASERMAARLAGSGVGTKADDDAAAKYSFREACSVALNRQNPSGQVAEMHQEAVKEATRAGVPITPGGVLVPSMILERGDFRKHGEKRTVTAGGTTAGGYTVATDLMNYIEVLRAKSILSDLGAEILTGAVGNIDIPKENAVYTPGWTTENGNASSSSPTFTKPQFSPKRLAGYIDLSNQWLMQTAPAFEQRIRNQIVLGQATAIDKAGIKGGGSNEPTGILATSNLVNVFAGNAASNSTNADGAAPVWADFINMWKLVGVANGLTDEAAYAITFQLAAILMQTKKDSGSGRMVLEDGKIDGFRCVVSNNVPSDYTKGSGTALSAGIFGNFSDLMIVQWGGLEIITDVVTQALAGTTRLVVSSYTDLAVLRTGSFSACKDFIAA